MWYDFAFFVAVGFAAQLVDGAIGMAYGITSTTVLLSLGTPPAVASAGVHAAEVFTTAISGLSHWRFRNVDWRLVGRLAVPGMIGGGAGAWLLTEVPGEKARPFVTGYLLLMGLWILYKALRRAMTTTKLPPKGVSTLGLVGGFFDAIGGGWGPIVSTTLIGSGTVPRYAIGSANLAEFFVTVTITGAFIFTIGLDLWPIIAGLILGGVVAAPIAAWVTSRMPARAMMVLVAVVICLLSIRGLWQALGG